MHKKFISIIIAAALAVSTFTAYAAYLDEEPFTDDFSDVANSQAVWKYTGANGDARNPSAITGYPENFVFDGEMLSIKANSSASFTAGFVSEELINDNMTIEAKINPVALAYIGLYASLNGGSSISVINDIYFRLEGGALNICLNHAYGVSNVQGKVLKVIQNFDPDAWIGIKIITNAKTMKTKIFLDSGAGYEDLGTHDYKTIYLPQGFVIDGLKRIGFTAYKGDGNGINVDDVKIQVETPLKVESISVEDGAVNFSDEKIDIKFNKAVANPDLIYLLNEDTGLTVDTENTSVEGFTISVPTAELDSLTNYKLVIPAGLVSEDDRVLESDVSVSFLTKMKDTFAITNANASGGSYSALITNSGEPQSVKVITAVYEVVNGVRRLKDMSEQTVSIDSEYSLSGSFNTEYEDYEFDIFVTDENYCPLTLSAAFDKDGNSVTHISDIVTEVSSGIDYENAVVSVSGNAGMLSYVHKNIRVLGDGEDVVFFGQTQTNENGSYSFKFSPDGKKAYSEYTIEIDGTEMDEKQSFTLPVDYSLFPVSIEIGAIEGIFTGNGSGEVKYTYESIIDDPEGNTEYVWEVSETKDGTFTTIDGANEKALSFNEDLAYKYVRAGVKPVSKNGLSTLAGFTYTEPVMIHSAPVASNVKITGSAVSGGTLKGSYAYSQKKNIEEKGTTYSYRKSSSINGEYTEVGNGLNYVVKASDAGSYIKLVVTPGCDGEPFTGSPAESEPIYINRATGGGGGSGGGGGGGGGGTVSSSAPAITGSQIGATVVPESELVEEKPPVFSDIESHWAKDNILRMYDKGVVKGKAEGEFAPDDIVTRAEFTAMITRALGIPDGEYVRMFGDVSKSDWYSGCIQSAVTNGFVSGDGENFRPNGTLSREEMAKIIVNAYEQKKGLIEKSEAEISDNADISEWAKEYVLKAYSSGLITGMEDGSFMPKKTATRAEACAVIARLLSSTEEVTEE